MAYGQYSAPPPAGERHCPQCGETMPASMDVCWLCLHKQIKQDATPVSNSTDAAIQAEPPKKPKRHRQHSTAIRQQAAQVDNMGTAILGAVAIVLCVALALAAPGALMLLAILGVPALIRTIVGVTHNRHRAALAPQSGQQPAATLDPLSLFFSSVAITVIVGIASMMAFGGAFVVACIPSFMLTAETNSVALFLVITMGAGLAAAVFVAVQVYKGFRVRRD